MSHHTLPTIKSVHVTCNSHCTQIIMANPNFVFHYSTDWQSKFLIILFNATPKEFIS